MQRWLHHIFFPHERNNHRSKLLHHSSLLILISVLLLLTFTLRFIHTESPAILGISYSITTNDLLSSTNKARQGKGITPLKINVKLSNAASSKAQDMFSKNYWAHFAPDGTSPWYFIKNSGYSYVFAGENLAKGFTTTNEVVDAWLNSASHRENLLSDKYDEIGFAVAEGKLLGEDTVLIVQIFGTSEDSYLARNNPDTVSNSNNINESENQNLAIGSNPSVRSEIAIKTGSINSTQKVEREVVFDVLAVSSEISLLFLAIILMALIIDFVIIERKKIPRLVGHNIDHILLITIFILFIIFSKKGVIF